MLALAYAWPVVLLARVLDRFGKGLRGSPRDALIADSTPPELRGRAFGFHRSADSIGAVSARCWRCCSCRRCTTICGRRS